MQQHQIVRGHRGALLQAKQRCPALPARGSPTPLFNSRFYLSLRAPRGVSLLADASPVHNRIAVASPAEFWLKIRNGWKSALTPLALAVAVVIVPVDPAPAAVPVATSGAAQELQQAYDKYSTNYDELDGGAAADALGFPQLRQQLLAEARGRTLEVAVGTGLNLQYYRWAQPPVTQLEEEQPGSSNSSTGTAGITSLDAVDLSSGMLAQAQARVRSSSAALAERPISFSQADVAALPFADSSFDSVVDTFSLCVFPDPQAALNELARVVRPSSAGGRVLLLEHSRSDNPLLAAYQDTTAATVAALGKGCVWNQDVEGLAARAGLTVMRAERSAAGTVELLVAGKQ